METIILGTFLAHFTGIFALAPFCSTSSQLAVSAHNQLSWGTTRRFRNSSTFSRAVVIMISFGGNIVVTHTAIKVTRIPRPRPPAISGDLSGAQFGARCLDCGTKFPRKPTGGVLSLLCLALIPWELVSSEVQLGNFQASILWCPLQFLASRHE